MFKQFALSSFFPKVLREYPNLRLRDKDNLVHNASDAAKCSRALSYKALGHEPSNPIDLFGEMRMQMGNYIEKGLEWNFFQKLSLFGIINLSAQGDVGEHGTFYDTSWHGYTDKYLGYKMPGGKIKAFIVELKTKVGFGAGAFIKKTPYSKEFITPMPDTEWGYAQQLSLYLRDGYNKTANNLAKYNLSEPIRDGILLYYLYADGICGLVEFHAEYDPESDSVNFYRCVSEQFPGCNGTIDLTIKLKDIADHWKKADAFIKKNKLAPPGFERKYKIDDERVEEATKTDLTKAVKGELVIGDMQCKYCAFKDKCAADLGISLDYTAQEKTRLKAILASK